MIRLGAAEPDAIRLGALVADRVYLGADQVWPVGALTWDSYVADTIDPVAWLKLEEAAGTAFADASGNGHDGTGSGTGLTLAQPGLIDAGGNAVLMAQPTITKIQIPHHADLNAADFAAAALVKFTDGGANRSLFSKDGADGNRSWGLRVNTGRFEFLVVSIGSGSATVVTTAGKLWNDGQRHLVVATYDGALAQVWVDGLRYANEQQTVVVGASTNPLKIGQGGRTEGTSLGWLGTVDEPMYVGRMLTREEIEQMAELALGITLWPATGLSYQDLVLADRPISYWGMGEASGTVLDDRTPYGRDLTLSGTLAGAGYAAPSLLDQGADPALTFDGNFRATHTAQRAWVCEALTVEAWVKTTQASLRTIAAMDSGTADKSWSLNMNATGKVSGVLYNGPGGVALGETTAVINDGQRHHVVFTRNLTSDAVRIYVDGVLSYSATVAQTAGAGSPTLEIGAGRNTNRWIGTIDEVATYDRELTAGEVAAHFAAGT